MLGANPFASNGSLMTAPDFPGGSTRCGPAAAGSSSSIRAASKTAEEADEHLFIRPGTDAHFLFAHRAHVVRRRARHARDRRPTTWRGRRGASSSRATSRPRSWRRCAASTPTTIRRIARELAAAARAAVYGRIGTCTQEFGTLASWLVDVVNVLTGNLDRPGGAMFTQARGREREHRWRRRASGAECGSAAGTAACAACPRSSASCRSSCLAEEIETPGEGQIRGLITVAGNPVLSHARRRPARPRRSRRSTSW